MTTIRIDTPRLIIRSPEVADADAVSAAVHASAAELRAWMPWADPVPTRAQTADNLAEAVAQTAAEKDYRLLLTTRDGGLVGSSGIHAVDWRIPSAEIGYWVDSRHAGRGYAREAAAAIAAFGRDVMGLRRIQIVVADGNAHSWRIAEHLGFAFEGVLREHRVRSDGRRDHTRIYARITPDAVGQEPWAGLHRRASAGTAAPASA